MLDASIDTFGLLVTCGSLVAGLAFTKPEWPMHWTGLGAFLFFLFLTTALPGRRVPKKKDA